MSPPPPSSKLSHGVYASFYDSYVSRVKNCTLSEALFKYSEGLDALFKNLAETQGLQRYANDKWSVKEVIIHCIDTERIFGTRALMIARGEISDQAGYDHEHYVRHSAANLRTLESLQKESEALRMSTATLFASLFDEQLDLQGVANGLKISTRAIAFVIAGHTIHHLHGLKQNYGLEF